MKISISGFLHFLNIWSFPILKIPTYWSRMHIANTVHITTVSRLAVANISEMKNVKYYTYWTGALVANSKRVYKTKYTNVA